MKDSRKQFEVTFSFVHCEAMATVEIKALDEAHAVTLAQATLAKELCPTLHHITEKA